MVRVSLILHDNGTFVVENFCVEPVDAAVTGGIDRPAIEDGSAGDLIAGEVRNVGAAETSSRSGRECTSILPSFPAEVTAVAIPAVCVCRRAGFRGRMKYPTRPGLGLFVVASLTVCAPAQTREQGPWWPNALWGATDQAGASNWITSEKILEAAKLVKTGKLYELGHPYEQAMPVNGQRSYKLTIPSFPTHGPVVSAGREVYFNDEFVAAEIGQVGTQFDGPGHVSQAVTMANGEKKIVFYNGFTAEELKNPYGLRQLGVEHVKPIFTRGLLLDIAARRGVEILPEGYVVTLADVQDTLAKEGLSEKDIRPGDALLFNFGWWKHWPDKISVDGRTPYVSDEVIVWIIARQPSMVGSDTNLDGPEFKVHTEIVLKHGIFNLELMTFDQLAKDKVYEFLFVFTPVPFKGATGSPGRPIAIR